MRPSNISPEDWRAYLDSIRQMSPEERLQRCFELSAEARSAAEARLREEYLKPVIGRSSCGQRGRG